MDYAEHFLERLVRMAPDEVRLALDFYFDSVWVRTLLGSLQLADGVERVAISLDDVREGPFLVVTRDGHFVSCLGRGMSVGKLTVVPRQRLDAAARKLGRSREQDALRARASEGDPRLNAAYCVGSSIARSP